jgi:hypothetical protein
MLLAIGQHLEDEFKLDRLVPYLIALLGDEVGLVRASTVKTLTHLVCSLIISPFWLYRKIIIFFITIIAIDGRDHYTIERNNFSRIYYAKFTNIC